MTYARKKRRKNRLVNSIKEHFTRRFLLAVILIQIQRGIFILHFAFPGKLLSRRWFSLTLNIRPINLKQKCARRKSSFYYDRFTGSIHIQNLSLSKEKLRQFKLYLRKMRRVFLLSNQTRNSEGKNCPSARIYGYTTCICISIIQLLSRLCYFPNSIVRQ